MANRSFLARWFKSKSRPQAAPKRSAPAPIESLEPRQLLAAAPTNLVMTPLNCCQIRLAWQDTAGDQAGFRVYRSSSPTGAFTQLQELDSNTLTYTDVVAPHKSYYYRVTAFNGGESVPLTGHVNSPVDPAGNYASAAKNLGTLTGGRVGMRNYIGPDNVADYWKFTVTPATTTESITLDQLGDDLDLAFFRVNADKTITHLDTSENSGTTKEFIQQTLTAGTYLVKIYRGLLPSHGAYRLFIAVDTAGDTRETDRYLGLLPASATLNEFVGSYDQDDYYKFKLLSTKTVSLLMSGLSGDADMELLDASGTQIQISENPATSNESIQKSLNAGFYYIHIFSYQGAADTNYKLTITAT